MDAFRWCPSFIKIRNFCERTEARTSGVRRADAEQLVDYLAGELPTKLSAALLPLELRFERNQEVTVPANSNVAREIIDY